MFELTRFARDAIRAVIDRTLTGSGDSELEIELEDLITILRAAGIEFVHAEQTTLVRAPETANRLGYPLVARARVPGPAHKSQEGAVIMGLKNADDVTVAMATLRRRATRIGALDRVFLQREIAGGIEMMAGVTIDSTFGPVMVCGLAGAIGELVKDVSFRLHPVTDIDADEMVANLKSHRLLEGYRGAPPGDRQALVALLTRVSAIVELVPELMDLELDPIKVMTSGAGALVIDGRMRLRRLGSEQPVSP